MSSAPPVSVLSRSFRLNWRGIIFLVLTLAVGFAAAVKGNNLLFIIFATLVGVFVASVAFTFLGPRGIEFTRLLPAAAFAYEPFSYAIRIRSRKRLLPAFGLRVDDRLSHDGRLAAMQPSPVFVPLAVPGEKLRATTSAAAYLRGPAKLGPITITSEFPPGLVTYSIVMNIEETILVYPRSGVIQRRILNPYLARVEYQELVTTASSSGDEEFAGLREYRNGDNPRRIHWKMLGRIPGQQIVKEFEDARVRRGVILLDTFLPNPNDRKRRSRLERAISFSSALAEALVAEGYTLRFRAYTPDLVDLPLEPRHGMSAELNHLLAGLRPSRIHTLADLAPEADPARDEVTFAIVVGDDSLPPCLPANRTIVIHAQEMRHLMYYAS